MLMSRVGEQLTWNCTCQTHYISDLPPCQHEPVQAHMHTPQLQSLVHKAYAYAPMQCRLEIRFSAGVFTSARCASYGGGDMITYCCTLSISSEAFAKSVVSYGIPAGPKSRLFDGDNMNTLM
jgi:hypothetical protein